MSGRREFFPNVIEMNHQARRRLGCCVYLVHDQSQWILIDIGYEDTVAEIIDMIRRMDFSQSSSSRRAPLVFSCGDFLFGDFDTCRLPVSLPSAHGRRAPATGRAALPTGRTTTPAERPAFSGRVRKSDIWHLQWIERSFCPPVFHYGDFNKPQILKKSPRHQPVLKGRRPPRVNQRRRPRTTQSIRHPRMSAIALTREERPLGRVSKDGNTEYCGPSSEARKSAHLRMTIQCVPAIGRRG